MTQKNEKNNEEGRVFVFFSSKMSPLTLTPRYSRTKAVKILKEENLTLCRDLASFIFVFHNGGKIIMGIAKKTEYNVNSYNKDIVSFCKCKCPDLIKQLILQG